MSRPVLYMTDRSPPSRGVLLTAAAIGLELEIREIDPLTGAHLTPEFLKINPVHSVPTLDDGGFIIWDSHAIMSYLVTKYGKNNSLYPKDPQIRAKIDQFLHFDTGYLFAALVTVARPLLRSNDTNIPADKLEILNNNLDIFDKLLEGKEWLVGNSYTLADISCVSTISSTAILRPMDRYPNIKAWLERCEKKLPGYAEKNGPGIKMLHDFIRTKLPGHL